MLTLKEEKEKREEAEKAEVNLAAAASSQPDRLYGSRSDNSAASKESSS